MERCLEEIGAAVLDAGDPISYRMLSARSQVSAAVSHQALARFATENDGVAALHVLVQRSEAAGSGKSETAKATRDPRARVVRLAVQTAAEKATSDGLLCQQIYALFSTPKDGGAEGKEAATALAIACWSQERKARNDVFEGVTKHTPLSAAAKAFYSSGVACTEATARQDFGDDQGEDTVSAFDAINASIKVKPHSSSFFKSSGKADASRTNSSVSKAPVSSRSSSSKKPEVKKLNADSMSNVLTVDSDDEDDEDDDAPVFVKKTTGATNGRSKRVISDDEDEEEEEEVQHVATKPARTPAKTRNVKRKLNASPAEPKKSKQTIEDSEEENEDEPPAKKKQRSDTEDDEDSASSVAVPTKRQVLVSKTRINEEGYMVTEKTYEEVELTAEEIEEERQAAAKKQQEQKKKMAAEKSAKAKKEAKKQAGPPKQRDLRSFFMKQ